MNRFNTHTLNEYDQEIPQSQTADKPCGIVRKSNTTTRDTWKTKQRTSSLFPIKMVAKLEWTQSNAQQNIKQPQNPTMGVKNKITNVYPE